MVNYDGTSRAYKIWLARLQHMLVTVENNSLHAFGPLDTFLNCTKSFSPWLSKKLRGSYFKLDKRLKTLFVGFKIRSFS